MEPGLHGPDRPIDRLGDLFVRQTLLVEKDEDHSIIRTETSQRSFEFAGQIVRVGQTRTVVDAFLGGFGEDGATAPATEGGPAAVRRDPEEPGTEGSTQIEAGDPAEGPNERLLNHVLGVLAVPHHPEAKAEDNAVEAVEQQTGGLGVARPERFDQRAVIHHAWPSPDDRDVNERSNVPGYLDREDHVSGFGSEPPLLRVRSLLGNEAATEFSRIGPLEEKK
jgi:hypothetical protein